MKTKLEKTNYAQMGIAALLPGMQYMLERMERELDELRAHLGLMQQEHGQPTNGASSKHAVAARSGWSDDPEERSREMKRRIHIAKLKQNPKDKGHPEHAKWVAKMSRIRKRTWANKTPEQRAAWQKALKEGRKRKRQEVA